MIFASDLDRTLIYGKKYINSEVNPSDVETLEIFEGKVITTLTKLAMQKLRDINAMITFIPSTTRTIDQFTRIEYFRNLNSPYVVACNGAHILINGEQDKHWEQTVMKEVEKTSAKLSEVQTKCETFLGNRWMEKSRKGDDVFFFYNLNPKLFPYDTFVHVASWCKEKGWTAYLQDKKLYVVPTCVNKVHALKYIENMLEKRLDVAAGDSLMDLEMLRHAGYAITPKHGEITSMKLNDGIMTTTSEGLAAAEEILNIVYNMAVAKKNV